MKPVSRLDWTRSCSVPFVRQAGLCAIGKRTHIGMCGRPASRPASSCKHPALTARDRMIFMDLAAAGLQAAEASSNGYRVRRDSQAAICGNEAQVAGPTSQMPSLQDRGPGVAGGCQPDSHGYRVARGNASSLRPAAAETADRITGWLLPACPWSALVTLASDPGRDLPAARGHLGVAAKSRGRRGYVPRIPVRGRSAAAARCNSRCPSRTRRMCMPAHRRSRRRGRGGRSITSPAEKSSCEPSLRTTRSVPAVTSATCGSSQRSVPA